MRIVEAKTYVVGNPWKNWVFVKLETDEGIYGIGEGTLNGFARTTEACIHELRSFYMGMDPFQIDFGYPSNGMSPWDGAVRYLGTGRELYLRCHKRHSPVQTGFVMGEGGWKSQRLPQRSQFVGQPGTVPAPTVVPAPSIDTLASATKSRRRSARVYRSGLLAGRWRAGEGRPRRTVPATS